MRFNNGNSKSLNRVLANERRLIEENARLKLKLHYYQAAFVKLDAMINSEPQGGIVNVVTFKAQLGRIISNALKAIGGSSAKE